jgi:hypothetical protein
MEYQASCKPDVVESGAVNSVLCVCSGMKKRIVITNVKAGRLLQNCGS